MYIDYLDQNVKLSKDGKTVFEGKVDISVRVDSIENVPLRDGKPTNIRATNLQKYFEGEITNNPRYNGVIVSYWGKFLNHKPYPKPIPNGVWEGRLRYPILT